MSDEEKVINELLRNEKCYQYFLDCLPISSTLISMLTGISVYKVRKILHNLKDKGLVRFERGVRYDDLSDERFFWTGWELTEEGIIKFGGKIE